MSDNSGLVRRMRAAWPDLKRPQRVRGLHDSATITRDRWGIPHVRARTPHNAWFGQGFAAAQDRMFQMDYDRRRAAGRWAELAGPPRWRPTGRRAASRFPAPRRNN